MSASCSPSQATENDNIQRNSKDIYNKENNYQESGTDQNNMLLVVHRENSALWFIVFFWRSTYVAYFDCSSWHCLVGRACGDTKWIPHGTVLADW